jgi:hypothetical protein
MVWGKSFFLDLFLTPIYVFNFFIPLYRSFLNFGYSIALSTGWLAVAATKVSNGVPSGCVYMFSIKYPSSSKLAIINQTQIIESVDPVISFEFRLKFFIDLLLK